MGTSGEPRNRWLWLLATFIFLAVFGIWLWLPLCFSVDVYAPVNALFSGLAFAGLIIAILLQREELQLQRRELALTREEMQGQKEQLEGQKRQMEIQNFKNRYFKLLTLWQESTSRLIDRHGHKGSAVFSSIADSFHNGPAAHEPFLGIEKELSTINSVVGDTAISDPHLTDTYLRLLQTIIRLTDTSDMEPKEKRLYINIVRSMLSQGEVVLIFYTGLMQSSRETWKPLLEKYSFLRMVNDDLLIKPEHRTLYDASAFN